MSPEKVVAVLTFMVIAVGCVMEATVGAKKMHGIRPIRYELPQSPDALQKLVNCDAAGIRANTYFDFFFIASYTTFFILAALLLPGSPTLRWPAAILAAIAGVCDVLENLGILAATRMATIDAAAVRSIRIPSTIKWLAIFVTLALVALKIGTAWLRWAIIACAAVGFVATIVVIDAAISGAMLLGFVGLAVFAVQTLRT